MIVRTLLLLLCSTFITLPMAAAQSDELRRIAGTYDGEVFNGNDLDPVVTSFTLDARGRLSGSYTVDEESGAYSGHLSSFVFEDAYTLTMAWTDKFGEGYATLRFSADYSSFSGEWTEVDGSGGLPWSGSRR